ESIAQIPSHPAKLLDYKRNQALIVSCPSIHRKMSFRRPDYSEPFFYDRDRSDPRNHVWKKIVTPFPPPRGLKRGEDISVASWNLNCTSRYAPERVGHALYLLQNYYDKYYKPYGKTKGMFMPPTQLR